MINFLFTLLRASYKSKHISSLSEVVFKFYNLHLLDEEKS